MIDTLTIAGLRGFGKEQTITFAKPDHQNEGSGLTFIVGANNTGKTTIVEAIRAFNCPGPYQSPSFSSDKRNMHYNSGHVSLNLKTAKGVEYLIKTVKQGGSTTELSVSNNLPWESQEIYVLNSRRSIQPGFQRYEQNKRDYLSNELINQPSRNPYLQNFGARLNLMNRPENRELVDPMLKEVLGIDLEWLIDEDINRQSFLVVKANGVEHISEGMGDGIWSIFTICDALYDLKENETLVIDEPELSLHPAYQKRVMELLKRKAKDRQIIICTHSPYFIDTEALMQGASLIRTHKDHEGNIRVFTLKDPKKTIKGMIGDINQPHTFGLEAKEIFFLEDCIVVTEGQEDVVIYKNTIRKMGITFIGNFFGWGAGGAYKIPNVLEALNELGYNKVSVIFDGDMKELSQKVKADYPSYNILVISKDDVRDKQLIEAKGAKEGLFKRNGELKEEYRAEVVNLFREIDEYFSKKS